MLERQVKVGGHYVATVSGVKTVVRLDAVREVSGYGPRSRNTKRFDVTNLVTSRRTSFRSAAKFQREATAAEVEKAKGGKKPAARSPYPTQREADEITPHLGRSFVRAEDGGTGPSGRPSDFDPSSVAEDEKSLDPTPAGSSPTSTTEGEQGDPFPAGGAATAAAPSLPSTTSARPAAGSSTLSVNALLANLAAAVKDDSPHLIVVARAGTGKTTTLVSALQRLKGIEPRAGNGAPMIPSPQQAAVWDAVCRSPRDSTVTFCAFNKSIATELQRRVPTGCAASTMHSLGFRAVRSALGRLEPTEWAGVDLIAGLLGTNARDLRREKPVLLKATDELVSLCKMNLADPTPENLDRLASYYDVELDRFRRDVFDLVPRALEAARSPKGRITYDDMIWLPVALGLPMQQSDLLLCDEWQDANRCMQALAKMAGRRLVMVGDPAQSIYGFCGADTESLARTEAELKAGDRGCETLPLTVTRRCGKAIVREARRWVPDFEAHESNPEGLILEARYPWRKRADGGTDALPWAETYAARCAPGDMVLCRTNAPLVKNCFTFIRRGIKANIQGRDVGRGLASLVEKLAGGVTLPAPVLVGKLSDWLDAETAKEQAKRNPSEARLTALTDKHDCLLAFCDGAADSAAVLTKIGSVFTDDKASPGVRLSSIHRAKGLEADRVFWLQPPEARLREDKMQPWELQQEQNLSYVATTRSVNELVHVS